MKRDRGGQSPPQPVIKEYKNRKQKKDTIVCDFLLNRLYLYSERREEN